ncbi:MAG TPA: hypothetical protein PKE30_08105 [Niabella sp.]|nr:hypothetical protein [Niabella sp.]
MRIIFINLSHTYPVKGVGAITHNASDHRKIIVLDIPDGNRGTRGFYGLFHTTILQAFQNGEMVISIRGIYI